MTTAEFRTLVMVATPSAYHSPRDMCIHRLVWTVTFAARPVGCP